MKFTIDLKEKKILIHQPFKKKDLDDLLSKLNLDNLDDYEIDVYSEPSILTYPGIPQPYTPQPDDWHIPYRQPYIIYDDWHIPYRQPHIIYDDGTACINSDSTKTSVSYTYTYQPELDIDLN